MTPLHQPPVASRLYGLDDVKLSGGLDSERCERETCSQDIVVSRFLGDPIVLYKYDI